MTLSPMEIDTTAIDRLAGAWPLTPATSIHEARAHLRNTGEPAAVVYRSGRPVGVVTAAALAPTVRHSDAPIATVMNYATVSVNPRADANETVRTFTRAAWDWLGQRRRPERQPMSTDQGGTGRSGGDGGPMERSDRRPPGQPESAIVAGVADGHRRERVGDTVTFTGGRRVPQRHEGGRAPVGPRLPGRASHASRRGEHGP
jgi:hypothetical protein